MLERRREPRLSWNCTAPPSETIQRPPRSRIGGYGSVLRPGPMILRRNKKLKTWLAGSQPVRVAGCRSQHLVGQVSRGLGARGPPGLGARPTRGLGPFPHKNHPNLSNFFANLLVGAWRRRGCRLKRLLRRWGPGGKRSPPRFGAVSGERKRVFTLSAFGNHPTRPPRSADDWIWPGHI